jgi:hypothetical protein
MLRMEMNKCNKDKLINSKFDSVENLIKILNYVLVLNLISTG